MGLEGRGGPPGTLRVSAEGPKINATQNFKYVGLLLCENYGLTKRAEWCILLREGDFMTFVDFILFSALIAGLLTLLGCLTED